MTFHYWTTRIQKNITTVLQALIEIILFTFYFKVKAVQLEL